MPDESSSVGGRRQSPRLKVDGRLHARIATLHLDVDMLDVGFGGFLVASRTEIASGDVHVIEVTTSARRCYTLKARVVHCRGPRDGEPLYLSGWLCATDETTQSGLNGIIGSLVGANDAEREDLEAKGTWKVATAWQLLMTVSTGAEAGHALVCPEVRYAAIRWHLAPQIDRRFGSSAMWRATTAELASGETGTVLPPDSMTSALLLPEALRTLCALTVERQPSIPAGTRDALTEALDSHLWYLDEAEFVRAPKR